MREQPYSYCNDCCALVYDPDLHYHQGKECPYCGKDNVCGCGTCITANMKHLLIVLEEIK